MKGGVLLGRKPEEGGGEDGAPTGGVDGYKRRLREAGGVVGGDQQPYDSIEDILDQDMEIVFGDNISNTDDIESIKVRRCRLTSG